MFYRPELTLDEMNHINFDWYAPKNAHRQSAEEVRAWCAGLGLAIEREQVEEAGITVIARKPAGRQGGLTHMCGIAGTFDLDGAPASRRS